MIKFYMVINLSSSDGNILSCFQAFIRIIPASSSVFLKEKNNNYYYYFTKCQRGSYKIILAFIPMGPTGTLWSH